MSDSNNEGPKVSITENVASVTQVNVVKDVSHPFVESPAKNRDLLIQQISDLRKENEALELKLRETRPDENMRDQYKAMFAEMEKDGRINSVYQHMLTEVNSGSDFFRYHLEELNLLSPFMEYSLKKGVNPRTLVIWRHRKSGGAIFNLQIGGGLLNIIIINKQMPTRADILYELITRLTIPEPIGAWIHENAHAIQHNLRGITPTETVEAQAHRMDPNDSVDRGSSESLGVSFTFPGRHPGTKIERAKYAVQAVDELCAIGCPVKKIAQLVSFPGIWDDKRKIYPFLEKAIIEERKILGFEEQDMGLVLEAFKLRRQVERNKAVIIARTIFQKYVKS